MCLMEQWGVALRHGTYRLCRWLDASDHSWSAHSPLLLSMCLSQLALLPCRPPNAFSTPDYACNSAWSGYDSQDTAARPESSDGTYVHGGGLRRATQARGVGACWESPGVLCVFRHMCRLDAQCGAVCNPEYNLLRGMGERFLVLFFSLSRVVHRRVHVKPSPSACTPVLSHIPNHLALSTHLAVF